MQRHTESILCGTEVHEQVPFVKKENLYELILDYLHCIEREWDLVGVIKRKINGKGQRDVTVQ